MTLGPEKGSKTGRYGTERDVHKQQNIIWDTLSKPARQTGVAVLGRMHGASLGTKASKQP